MLPHTGARLPFTLLAAFMGACAAQQPPPPAPATAAPAGSSASPAVAAPASAAPAASSAAVAAPPPPSPFSIVATGDGSQGPIWPLAMDNALFFATDSYLVEARGNDLVESMNVLGPLKLWENMRLLTLVGSWPTNAYAVVNTFGGCDPGTSALLRWRDDTWVKLRPKEPLYIGATAWGTDGVAALAGYYDDMKLTAAVAGKTPLPRLFAAPAGGDVEKLVVPAGLVAGADGSLFAYGQGESGNWLVRHWDPVRKQVDAGPLRCGADEGPVIVAGLTRGQNGQVYAYGQRASATQPSVGYIGAFDGQTWQCQDTPDASGVEGLAVGADGSLWALAVDGERRILLERGAGAQWREVTLPTVTGAAGEERFVPSAVVVRGSSDVWLTGSLVDARSAERAALAHNQAAAKVLELPPSDASRQELAEYQPPVPATRGCETIYALLYGLTKMAPADYDYPLTRAALKGHTEFTGLEFIETISMGKRYFGVMVRSYDEGLKLVDVIKKGVKGSIPVLLCREPAKINRKIGIDLRTGALLPSPPP